MKQVNEKIQHYIDFMRNVQIYAQNMHKHCSAVKYAYVYANKMHEKHKFAFGMQCYE